jgi:hypothetical protein
MKKLLVLIAGVLLSVSSYGQTKINGFGKIQLGMSVSDLPELSNSKLVTTETDYFNKVYRNVTSSSYETISDTTKKYQSFGSLDKRVRIFQIGRLQLTDKIILSDVTLKFFNDKLYSINVNDKQLDELLTTKYGTPKEDIKTKENTFQNSYGAKFVKTDLTKTHNWETGNINTICSYTDMYWYNDSGKLNGANYAHLYDRTITDFVGVEESVVKARINKREEDKKKGLVSGF